MAYDLAISSHGDIILAGNRDFAGVSGPDLVEQRIVIRLVVHRGAWFYDPDGVFGSDLYQVLGKSPQLALEMDARVRDALRDMGDISIEQIDSHYDDDAKSVVVKVNYVIVSDPAEELLDSPTGELQQSTIVTIPVVAGGGEAG